ncbi:MAG: methyltransferase domain-containing protein [Planctomycetes bacterium]|nr:methyltransferase domain-containing protein [Planctomycetota bacterium]
MAAPGQGIPGVRAFWGAEPCGTRFTAAPFGSPAFYEEYAEFRFSTEWHLLELVPFAACAGKELLEIGTGLGADGVRFARHGAIYTGLDVTGEAVRATREHFRAFGLAPRLLVGDAERLPFPDASFDVVYSHGALHHTPHPDRAFDELHRVLRPGGHAILMLYHRASANYYVRILAYMRARLLAHVVLRRFFPSSCGGDWEVRYRRWKALGNGFLSAEEFTHSATDGAGCPYAFTYTRRSARRALSLFRDVRFAVAHFPLGKYIGPSAHARSGTRRALRWIERLLARNLGWYLFVWTLK